MADCLPSARTCSLVSVISLQTLLRTVHDRVSVHKWLGKGHARGRLGNYLSRLVIGGLFLLTTIQTRKLSIRMVAGFVDVAERKENLDCGA